MHKCTNHRQVIVNIRTQSVEGLALPFLANWLFGTSLLVPFTGSIALALTATPKNKIIRRRVQSHWLHSHPPTPLPNIPGRLLLLRRFLPHCSILLLLQTSVRRVFPDLSQYPTPRRRPCSLSRRTLRIHRIQALLRCERLVSTSRLAPQFRRCSHAWTLHKQVPITRSCPLPSRSDSQ